MWIKQPAHFSTQKIRHVLQFAGSWGENSPKKCAEKEKGPFSCKGAERLQFANRNMADLEMIYHDLPIEHADSIAIVSLPEDSIVELLVRFVWKNYHAKFLLGI